MATMQKKTYTVEEAATALGIGRSLAYELIRAKRIPVLRLGKRIVIPVLALDRMLAEAGQERRE